MILDVDLTGHFLADRRKVQKPAALVAIDPELPESAFLRSVKPPAPAGLAVKRPERSSGARRSKPLPPGALVDKFRIGDVLGTGGFAVVYRATHLLLDTAVALKLLKPDVLAARPGIGALLVEEARFAARINHPNVVRILDVTHSETLTYIVMELIDGVALSRRLSMRGPLDLQKALNVAIDVASGLAAGLEQGLVHRDIKPANVLLSKDGSARIVDYGMAHALEQDNWLAPASARAVVGTRGYMAPEQASGKSRVDFRADIYALGVTLEEACRGSGLWDTAGPSGAIANSAALPPRLLELLAWMQAPEPEQRPASYAALIDALCSLQRELSAAPQNSVARGEPSRTQSHRAPRLGT
jgi:serine/threonine-protein kinase